MLGQATPPKFLDRGIQKNHWNLRRAEQAHVVRLHPRAAAERDHGGFELVVTQQISQGFLFDSAELRLAATLKNLRDTFSLLAGNELVQVDEAPCQRRGQSLTDIVLPAPMNPTRAMACTEAWISRDNGINRFPAESFSAS